MPRYRPPGRRELDLLERLLAPWARLFEPTALNLERIPEASPLLFVGNHTLGGVIDVPHFYLAVARQRGVFLRPLGDHFHFKVPLWSELLTRFGVVDGTRENCARLLAEGQPVLVFPGGAREVAKRRGEQYTLVWKQRIGFARMALRHGATVVPFAALGADEAFDIWMDADQLRALPVGGLLERAYRRLGVPLDSMLPLVRGLGPTPLPRPVKLYFSVAEPIPAADYAGPDEEAAAWALREAVAASIRAELGALEAVREADPRSRFLRRI